MSARTVNNLSFSCAVENTGPTILYPWRWVWGGVSRKTAGTSQPSAGHGGIGVSADWRWSKGKIELPDWVASYPCIQCGLLVVELKITTRSDSSVPQLYVGKSPDLGSFQWGYNPVSVGRAGPVKCPDSRAWDSGKPKLSASDLFWYI